MKAAAEPALRLVGASSSGSVLQAAGLPAQLDQALAWTLLAGGGAVFLAVMLVLAWALPGRRKRPRARWWTVGAGLVVPGLVLAALQVANLRDIVRREAAAPGELLIGISARLWWWEVRVFPGGDGAPVVLANELRLPVGRPVRLALGTEEVIHSLWLPALAGKVDVLPGRVQHVRVQAQRAGQWSGPCAEYCGSGHAGMVLHVVAQPVAEFERWLQGQQQDARLPAGVLESAGRAEFERLRCNACHAVRGVFAVPVMAGAEGVSGAFGGPDLTHLASRATLGAGVLRNDAAGLRRWITSVQHVKPGARMPSYDRLDAAQLDALVAWLGSLH